MTDWVDKYVNEKRFKEKFEALETTADKVKFCEQFIADHGMLPSKKTIETQPSFRDMFQQQPHEYETYRRGPIETLTYTREVTELEMQEKMFPEYLRAEIVRAIAEELYEKSLVKFRHEKRMIDMTTVFKAELKVMKP